jgi:Zn-dependent protease/predicted transcriptional regulator
MQNASGITSFLNNTVRENPLVKLLELAFVRGSFRVATFLNIPVRIHWSFSLLILFIIYMGKTNDSSWLNIGINVLMVFALFTCVLLHEFGHALAARYFGVPTRDITILPIGGMARLDKLPEKPFQEFIVAIAGPVVNLLIFILLYAFLYLQFHLTFNIDDLLHLRSNRIILDPVAAFLGSLLHANLLLAIFNMVPAFPLDGGRVFRALLSIPLGRVKATAWAVFLGQTVAIGFFIGALLPLGLGLLPPDSPWRDVINWSFQPVLMFISFFVIYTARHEYDQVLLEKDMSEKTVADIMSPVFVRFQTIDVMNTAIEKCSNSEIKDFLVFDNDQILRGVLQEHDINTAKKNNQFDALIATYTTTDFQFAKLTESIKSVYDRMIHIEQSLFPVLNTEGSVVGVVDYEMMQDFMKR